MSKNIKDNKCSNCSQQKSCGNSFVSWVFFIIGLVATVAIRIVTVLMNVHSFYGKIAWYVGVGGFFVFFVYKFHISRILSNIIKRENLIEKARNQNPLSKQEYTLIAEILCNLKSEKERINYFFIFAVSALALLIAVYLDFIK